MTTPLALIAPYLRASLLRLIHGLARCPVCDCNSLPLDIVDLNKSCAEQQGKFLPKSGKTIVYYLCPGCGFCFAPEMAMWSQSKFAECIYNQDYVLVDPDYIEIRPRNFAEKLIETFPLRASAFQHLDYGSGSGLMSNLLRERGWQSVAYDPFVNREAQIDQLGKFDLITAYEVFEHVPDPRQLMHNLSELLAPKGVILFSTLLSDGYLVPHRKLTWWYASPRNGHISLFSKQSLQVLAKDSAFHFGSFSEGSHCMWRSIPPWALHILPPRV
jgi:SAM-dependent methyltransferase